MEENSQWQIPKHAHYTCFNSFWKKLPTRNQTVGGIIVGTGIALLSLSLIFPNPSLTTASILWMGAGLAEFKKQDTQLNIQNPQVNKPKISI